MKKGFTLIELITTIGLIAILLGISFPSIRAFNGLKSKIEMNLAVSSIVEFINGCKSYSRSNSLSTKIKKEGNNTEISQYLGSDKIRFYSLPKRIKISIFNPNTVDNAIHIDNFGVTNDACTITLMNEMQNIRSITLKVGTWYVSEKK